MRYAVVVEKATVEKPRDGMKMSKSLGNGVDPLDIIDSHGADAMRFVLCHMTTQTQDVRMPVDILCPHCAKFEPIAEDLKKSLPEGVPMKKNPEQPSFLSETSRLFCISFSS